MAFELSSEASVGCTRRWLVAECLGKEAPWAGAPRGERGWHPEGADCAGVAGVQCTSGHGQGPERGGGELDDAGGPRIVIKIQSNSNEIEMKPFGSSCDVFLLKSLKLSLMSVK